MDVFYEGTAVDEKRRVIVWCVTPAPSALKDGVMRVEMNGYKRGRCDGFASEKWATGATRRASRFGGRLTREELEHMLVKSWPVQLIDIGFATEGQTS